MTEGMKLYARKGRVWYVRFPNPAGGEVRLSTDVNVDGNREATRKRAGEVAKEKMRDWLSQNDPKQTTAGSSEGGTDEVATEKVVKSRIRACLAWALQREFDLNWSKVAYGRTMGPTLRKLQKQIGHWLITETTYAKLEDVCAQWSKNGGRGGKPLANASLNRRLSMVSKALNRCVEHGTTKNDKPRRIPLTARAKRALDYMLTSPSYAYLQGLYREDPTGKRAWDWCAYRWDRAMYELGINTEATPKRDRMTMHTLRHTFGSRLVQRGVSLITVRDLMGHKDIKTRSAMRTSRPTPTAERWPHSNSGPSRSPNR